MAAVKPNFPTITTIQDKAVRPEMTSAAISQKEHPPDANLALFGSYWFFIRWDYGRCFGEMFRLPFQNKTMQDGNKQDNIQELKRIYDWYLSMKRIGLGSTAWGYFKSKMLDQNKTINDAYTNRL